MGNPQPSAKSSSIFSFSEKRERERERGGHACSSETRCRWASVTHDAGLRYSPNHGVNDRGSLGVTTHLPNELALKMDGAEANDLYSTISANAKR